MQNCRRIKGEVIKLGLIVVLSINFNLSVAQQSKVDSIKKLLSEAPSGRSYTLGDTILLYNLYNLSAECFKEGESDSMYKYAKEGLTLSRQFQQESKSVIEKNILKKYEMAFYRNLGISYFDKGDYPTQIKYFHDYLNAAIELNLVKDIGTAYANIATCHREMDDLKTAFEFAQKSINVLKGTPYKNGMGSAYSIYASYYQNYLSNYDSAYYYKKLVHSVYKEANNKSREVSSLLDLILFFQAYRQMDSCMVYLGIIEEPIKEIGNPENLMIFNALKGLAMFSKGKNEEAKLFLTEAKKNSVKTEDKEDDANIDKYLALTYASLGNPIEALNMLDSAFNAYSDDLNLSKVRSLTQAQMNYDFEKERTLAAEENKRQKLIRNFSIAGGLIMLLFALFIFQRYRERHKTSLLLAEKNRQIEYAYNELKNTQQELVQTEKQREAQSIRVRIARDIHDDIGSGLTKITLLSDVAKKKSQQPEVTESLSKITSYSKAVSASLSEIVWAINPGNDNAASLVNYMKVTANNLLEDSGIKYNLNLPEKEIVSMVHPEIKRNIYLVMKEGINNALKYANAKNIYIGFAINENSFRLEVIDDGVGFELNRHKNSASGGNGLLNMQQRMLQHQNSIEIVTAPGKGCKIIAEGKLS